MVPFILNIWDRQIYGGGKYVNGSQRAGVGEQVVTANVCEIFRGSVKCSKIIFWSMVAQLCE